jgi:large subunit ribosomal protein L9
LKGLETMKVLLIQDVYKLGRAGDVKKVADGFGRNYLIPQGLAVLATPGALKQTEHIRSRADAQRAIINQEMSNVAEMLADVTLSFPAKAGETGKLYGSVTPAMIAEGIQEETGVEINRRQMDLQPIRNLGIHKVDIRLTIDLIPEITVIVYREGESVEMLLAELAAEEEAAVEALVEGDFAVEAEATEAEVESVSSEEEVETEAEVESVSSEEEVETEAEVESVSSEEEVETEAEVETETAE